MLKHEWKRSTKKDIIVMENNTVVATFQMTTKQRINKHAELTQKGYTRISQNKWGFTYNK